jgi:hypothetical protein
MFEGPWVYCYIAARSHACPLHTNRVKTRQLAAPIEGLAGATEVNVVLRDHTRSLFAPTHCVGLFRPECRALMG